MHHRGEPVAARENWLTKKHTDNSISQYWYIQFNDRKIENVAQTQNVAHTAYLMSGEQKEAEISDKTLRLLIIQLVTDHNRIRISIFIFSFSAVLYDNIYYASVSMIIQINRFLGSILLFFFWVSLRRIGSKIDSIKMWETQNKYFGENSMYV